MALLIDFRVRFTDYSVLLTEYRARLTEYRALLGEHAALLIDYRALCGAYIWVRTEHDSLSYTIPNISVWQTTHHQILTSNVYVNLLQ